MWGIEWCMYITKAMSFYHGTIPYQDSSVMVIRGFDAFCVFDCVSPPLLFFAQLSFSFIFIHLYIYIFHFISLFTIWTSFT